MSVDYVRELQALRRKASGRARSKRNVSSRRHLGLERLESRQLLTAGVELMEPEAWIVPAVLEDGTAQEAWAVPAETLLISDEALRTPLMAWEEVPMGDGTAEPVFVTFAAFDAEPLMLKAEMEESVPVAYEAGAVEVLAGTDESTWEKPFVASLDDSGDDRIYMMTMMSVDANLDTPIPHPSVRVDLGKLTRGWHDRRVTMDRWPGVEDQGWARTHSTIRRLSARFR